MDDGATVNRGAPHQGRGGGGHRGCEPCLSSREKNGTPEPDVALEFLGSFSQPEASVHEWKRELINYAAISGALMGGWTQSCLLLLIKDSIRGDEERDFCERWSCQRLL